MTLMALMILTNRIGMQENDRLIKNQDSFFKSKKTLSINYRKDSLIRLKKAINAHEEEIIEALYKDLKKPKLEAYASEIGVVLTELNYFIKNIAEDNSEGLFDL